MPGCRVNEIDSRLSDSELISIRFMAQDRADGRVVAEVEAELVRRADRSHRHAVRLKNPLESVFVDSRPERRSSGNGDMEAE